MTLALAFKPRIAARRAGGSCGELYGYATNEPRVGVPASLLIYPSPIIYGQLGDCALE